MPRIDEGIGALLKVDALLAHPVRQPVMLIEADPRRERQVGADAHEHAAPALVVDIEVVLDDPALGELQMPAVGRLVADRDHDARRFARLQDDDDLIRLGPLKYGSTNSSRRPFGASTIGTLRFSDHVFSHCLKLIGDAAQTFRLTGYSCR